MIDKSTLFAAKAFLGWDKFPHLSIKLIPIEEVVAFFYPPTKDISTINLFYEKHTRDFSRALFLLFHEAGHLKQWEDFSDQNKQDEFWRLINQDKGKHKLEFEREAWTNGEALLREFIENCKSQDSNLIVAYKQFLEQCLLTYC